MKKICSRCNLKKDISEFGKRTDRKIGVRAACKKCERLWCEAHASHLQNYRLIVRWNITLDEYNKILNKQNGVCAICKRKPKEVVRQRYVALAVDHDHKTGKIRGLLCYKCNSALGMFDDNIATMQNAIDYINGYC